MCIEKLQCHGHILPYPAFAAQPIPYLELPILKHAAMCYTSVMFSDCRILLLCLPWTAAALTFTTVCELDRPDEPTSLSSLSFVSNGVYWSSTDWKPALHEIVLRQGADGKPDGLTITRLCALEGAKDVEGIAYDPLRGTFWAADEVYGKVSEHDPRSGRRLGDLKLSAIFKKCRRTYGFESLCIRPDGLEMWLANEEALSCDGPVSTSEHGTTVRLARFTRTGRDDAWKAAGQWAYATDSLGGGAPLNACRSGLTSLCALEDGTLLALEREYSFKPLPALRCRIYATDRSQATDIAARESLAPGTLPFTPVAKTLLYDADTGLSMYEGLAPGPIASDGSRLFYLISDGDKMMAKKLRVLRLSK